MNSWLRSACYPRRTFYPLSDGPSMQNHRTHRVVSHRWLLQAREPGLKASHLSCAASTVVHSKGIVKVHGVFPSSCGQPASSPALQIRRASWQDSRTFVTPFVQVGTYPTRNFATLGPL